jgi:ketosteroid isomerase-like protein
MTTVTDDLQAIAELNLAFMASVAAGDVSGLDAIFAEDFLCTNPDGSFVDRTEYLALLPSQPPMPDLKGDDIMIRVFEGFAIVHTHISWRRGDGTTGHGRFTDDYAFRDGRWQCVSAQVTGYQTHPVPDPALF